MRSVVLVSLGVLMGCANPGSPKPSASVETVTFDAPNVGGGCWAGGFKPALEKLAGVHSVDVQAKTVTVTREMGRPTDDEILATLKEAGFAASRRR